MSESESEPAQAPFPDVQAVVASVIQKCREEADGSLQYQPNCSYQERAASYTGIPKEYIDQLCQDTFTPEYDSEFLISILTLLQKFYVSQDLISVSELFGQWMSVAKKQDYFDMKLTQFKKTLTYLGFNYVKTSKGFLYMQNPEITFTRFRYLNKIRNARSDDKHIYYLDLKKLDLGKGCVVSVNPNNKTEEQGSTMNMDNSYLFHTISADGFANALFCSDMTYETCVKWVLSIVIPSLAPESLVVINNCPVFGATEKQIITCYDSCKDMMRWLKEKNIPYGDCMRKPQLYDLIQKCSVTVEKTNIDSIFKAYGHNVVRTPILAEDLNVCSMFWQTINRSYNNRTKKQKAKTYPEFRDAINETIQQQKRLVPEIINKILVIERKLFVLDAGIEILLDNYDFH